MGIALFWVDTQRVLVTLTDVSEQPAFKDQEFLTPKDGADRLPQNVGKKWPLPLHNNTEERSSQATVCHLLVSLTYQF
jgi:hypothetical protein